MVVSIAIFYNWPECTTFATHSAWRYSGVSHLSGVATACYEMRRLPRQVFTGATDFIQKLLPKNGDKRLTAAQFEEGIATCPNSFIGLPWIGRRWDMAYLSVLWKLCMLFMNCSCTLDLDLIVFASSVLLVWMRLPWLACSRGWFSTTLGLATESCGSHLYTVIPGWIPLNYSHLLEVHLRGILCVFCVMSCQSMCICQVLILKPEDIWGLSGGQLTIPPQGMFVHFVILGS